MNRSPLFYPLNRGGDGEAGGPADLQTDIMRFMAILALCLVAVFALVQSIPLTPPARAAIAASPGQPQQRPAEKVAAESARDSARADTTSVDAVAAAAAAAETVTSPAPPEPATPPEPAPSVAPAAAQNRQTPPAPAGNDDAPSAPSADKGFTLRFASDQALMRLVARNDVALYAMRGKHALKMSVRGDRFAFRPASVPGRFHEMDTDTVPGDVIAALRRAGQTNGGRDVKWGVTLPAGTRGELDRYLTGSAGGALVIDANGHLRLER